jgi:serine/threonine-protein kinase
MDTMIGRFRVGSAIPDAPSGLRYNGRDLARVEGKLPRPVWLQFFGQQASPNLVRKQANAWLGFEHTAFVPFVAYETEPGKRVLVATDVGNGMFLRRRLQAGPMPTVEVAKLALLLCELLVDAHHRGLLHLGLCTESILVPQHGSGGPQLFGVGIGQPLEWSQLEINQFLAPEQMASGHCDQRSDVYSLGIVMFRCATGQYPVDAPSSPSRAVSGHPRDPRRWLSSDAEPLARIIERCIAADPAHRFQTSTALADAIRSSGLLHGEHCSGIVLTPPTSLEPNKRAGIDQSTLPPTAVAGTAALISPPEPASAPARRGAVLDNLVGQHIKELRIERLLEETASSRIFLAKHTRVPRSWVVKVAKGRRLDAAKRYEQEARVTAALRERGERVVEVLDWGQLSDGQPYLVMELVEGRTLDKVLVTNPTLPIEDCLAIINSVCATLEHAHDLGYLHRDIKPANIMLQEKFGCRTGTVIVLDWGMARGAGAERINITKEGEILGTAGYRAPETAVRVDGRADTFSAATVLYEMLAGRRAFEGRDEHALTVAVNNYYPPPLATLRPAISQALSEVVARGMAKDREKRPDMQSFRRSLFVHVEQHLAKREPERLLRLVTDDRLTNTVPLARMATRVPQNSESRDMLRRLIGPEKTRPMPPASKVRQGVRPQTHTSKRRRRLSGAAIIVTVAAMMVIAYLEIRGHAPVNDATRSSTTRNEQSSTAPARLSTTIREGSPAAGMNTEAVPFRLTNSQTPLPTTRASTTGSKSSRTRRHHATVSPAQAASSQPPPQPQSQPPHDENDVASNPYEGEK